MIRASHLNPERAILTSLVRFDKEIVRAEGNDLFDRDGRQYVDFSSQYGALPFGHNPEFLRAVVERVFRERGPSFVQPMVSPAAEALARRLSDVAPGGGRYVVFTNSGAEAVETAIKLARAHTRRPVILATHNGFHGKTLGAVSATGTPIYRVPFGVDTTAFEHVAFDDVEALAERLERRDVAAFIVEPIQGEGGMITPAPGYLRRVEELCRAHGTLLVLDEVQTGLGRTGRLFAGEWDGVNADVILLAKALGGGLVPLGACLVAPAVWPRALGLYHSSTFANNNLTCSVGVAVLEQLTRDDGRLVREVAATGDYLEARLRALAERYPEVFGEVRGRGLMLGMELAPWPVEDSYFLGLVNQMGLAVPLVSGYLLNEHGVVVLPTISRSNALRVQPSFVTDTAQAARLLEALEEAAQLIRGEQFGALLSYATGGAATVRTPLSAARNVTPAKVPPREERLGSFAFFMHPTDFDDILRSLPSGCDLYPPEQRARLVQWIDQWRGLMRAPAPVYHLPALRSRKGGYVEGWLISSMLTPSEMMRLKPADRAELIDGYVAAARNVGARVVGLGAFTSVVTRGGAEIDAPDLAITTGNSFTALTCVASLRQVADARHAPLASQTVAVIGAAGSVGRLVALDVASHCRRLILFGNPTSPTALSALESVAGEIYRNMLTLGETAISGQIRGEFELLREVAALEVETGTPEADRLLFRRIDQAYAARLRREPPVRVSVNPAQDLRHATSIVSATSNGKAFIEPGWVAPSAIVCDAARPADIAGHVAASRPDLFVFEGGLVRLPEPASFGRRNVLGLPPGINLACLCETIALAMADARRNYSIGNRIPLAEAREVFRIATAHGFEPAAPHLEASLNLVAGL